MNDTLIIDYNFLINIQLHLSNHKSAQENLLNLLLLVQQEDDYELWSSF